MAGSERQGLGVRTHLAGSCGAGEGDVGTKQAATCRPSRDQEIKRMARTRAVERGRLAVTTMVEATSESVVAREGLWVSLSRSRREAGGESLWLKWRDSSQVLGRWCGCGLGLGGGGPFFGVRTGLRHCRVVLAPVDGGRIRGWGS